MKIAMLGGSFNPVHIGHLALADEVIHALGYHKIIFVPARERPLKTMAQGACGKDRLAMTKIATAGNPAFVVDTCEMEREGPSYTYDTIEELEKKYRLELQGKIGLIIGDDLLESFHQWYKHDELPRKTDIILARRAGISAVDFPYIELKNSVLDISSSDIRQRIEHGFAWEYLAGQGVCEYIKKEKLYGYKNF